VSSCFQADFSGFQNRKFPRLNFFTHGNFWIQNFFRLKIFAFKIFSARFFSALKFFFGNFPDQNISRPKIFRSGSFSPGNFPGVAVLQKIAAEQSLIIAQNFP